METERKNQLGKKNLNFDPFCTSSFLGLDRDTWNRTCFKQLSSKHPPTNIFVLNESFWSIFGMAILLWPKHFQSWVCSLDMFYTGMTQFLSILSYRDKKMPCWLSNALHLFSLYSNESWQISSHWMLPIHCICASVTVWRILSIFVHHLTPIGSGYPNVLIFLFFYLR